MYVECIEVGTLSEDACVDAPIQPKAVVENRVFRAIPVLTWQHGWHASRSLPTFLSPQLTMGIGDEVRSQNTFLDDMVCAPVRVMSSFSHVRSGVSSL